MVDGCDTGPAVADGKYSVVNADQNPSTNGGELDSVSQQIGYCSKQSVPATLDAAGRYVNLDSDFFHASVGPRGIDALIDALIKSQSLNGSFTSFATGARPDFVWFKSLYCFARDEGYPVKQQWFPTLPVADREAVATLLNRPLAEQTATLAAVARLQKRLEEYLTGHTEILLD